MEKKYYTKKDILESKYLMEKEGGGILDTLKNVVDGIANSKVLENTLMVAGFVPIVGEIADIVLICMYLWRKDYLYAALMLIALVPMVGDVIAKPFITVLKNAGAAGRTALRSGDDMTKFLMENPAAKEQFLKMAKHFDNPSVNETIRRLGKVNSNLGERLLHGVNSLKSAAGKLKPARLGKRVGQEIASQGAPGFLKTITGRGPVAMGVKNFFREERLAQYIAKHGKKPSNWISNWYYIIRGGASDRRKMVKALIVSSGILNFFGLPSFESFEDKLQKDPNFANQLANNPQFGYVVNNSGVTPQELATLNGQGEKSEGPGLMGGVMGLGMLKMMAKMLT